MDRHDLENISLDALSDYYTEKTGDQLNPLYFCLPRKSWQVWLDSCEEGKFYFTQAELDAAVCGKPFKVIKVNENVEKGREMHFYIDSFC